MVDFCFLLWISVVACNPVAQNYRDTAGVVPPQHLALVREIEITREDHAFATYDAGRISLPARRDNRLLYNFTHEVGHLVFYANDQDLTFAWMAWFWWNSVPSGQLSGYTTRVLAEGDWWKAVKEDAAESYSALFTGDPLDPGRRAWLCEQVEGLADVAGCVAAAP